MTTPLSSEPVTGDGQVPYMSTLVDRLYSRLPEVFRTVDAADRTWTIKRYLGAVLAQAGAIDNTIDGFAGRRPIGPATPEPWGLTADRLAQWRDARQNRLSSLGDPAQADSAWLQWLAQLVGARLDPTASDAEKRDTITYATSGWRGGTRGAIEDAARSALTGTRYARAVPGMIPATGAAGLVPGGVWDITIVTRAAETPDASVVLGAILRKGVKPAGATLHHQVYTVSWDALEAARPTWADWEAAGNWNALEETAVTYAAVSGNLLSNPSFEIDAAGWTARSNSTIGRVTGGLDGVGMGRVTAVAAGTAGINAPPVTVTPGTAYRAAFSLRPTAARSGNLGVDWYNGGTFVSSAPLLAWGPVAANSWQRVGENRSVTAPAGVNSAHIYVETTGMAIGEWFDLDSGDVRPA